MNTPLKYLLALTLVTAFPAACKQKKWPPRSTHEVALAWADLTLFITKNTPANSPTFASRSLGYTGLTMYESIVPGYPEYESLAGQLNGLSGLPRPEPGKEYQWILSLNAGQASILRNIYIQTSDANKQRIDSLEKRIYDEFAPSSGDPHVTERSVSLGRSIAEHIFEWSRSDGGHRGYLKNFEKKRVYPSRPGSWQPPLYAQSFMHYPLHPSWGENRTFILENSSLPMQPMYPYDTSSSSAYYQQFKQVYQKEKELTQEEKEIALWWGDDPDVTFTPPGHSYFITSQVIKIKKPDLIRCAEAYARTGMAVADAFINCWKWKYHYFAERPNTFIPAHMDQEWVSFWPDPPFPAFPSGHAIQASAVSEVLINLFGDSFTFTDSAHINRQRDEIRNVDFVPRTFHSFSQVALEIADSRFYGGIHTPQDNKAGLEQGKKIGRNINKLSWRHEQKNQ